MKELFTLRGEASGTGDYTLRGDLIYGTATAIRIPKGLKAKIWCKRIAGEAAQVTINYTKDITASSPTWVAVDTENLASAGELVIEKRRPIILRSATGKEAFKVTRDSGTGSSFVDLEVELTDEE